MYEPKRHKPEKHPDKVLQNQKNIQNRIENIKNQNSNFIISLNNLKNALKGFQTRKLSYEQHYQKAKKDLFGIHLDYNLDTLLKEIAEELCGLVPLNDYMIMGFIKRGIINWQIKTNTPILAFTKMDPHKKLQVIS